MGLSIHSIKLLFEAKEAGVSFARTLTLGKQSFSCHTLFLEELIHKYGYSTDRATLGNTTRFTTADFFRMLGAQEVLALDNSQYEGAELVHDMNAPIPDELRSRFDAVLDGGTLEHIFNFPVAVKNCMDMVRLNGHLLLITPINNYCGHGFYQFSPELLFRTLCRENGYSVEQAVAWEECGNSNFFIVSDPEVLKRRVELVNGLPILMFVQAKKIAEVERLTVPQQSDYARLWNDGLNQEQNADSDKLTIVGALKDRLIKACFRAFPHWTNGMLGTLSERKIKKTSLRQGPGFVDAGKLSSRDPTDRLAMRDAPPQG